MSTTLAMLECRPPGAMRYSLTLPLSHDFRCVIQAWHDSTLDLLSTTTGTMLQWPVEAQGACIGNGQWIGDAAHPIGVRWGRNVQIWAGSGRSGQTDLCYTGITSRISRAWHVDRTDART